MNLQEHLLTILIEECNEVAQRATKALRFGLEEVQPDQPLTNAERIVYEYNDLLTVISMLTEKGFISNVIHAEMMIAKKEKIIKYLEYSKSIGTLTE